MSCNSHSVGDTRFHALHALCWHLFLFWGCLLTSHLKQISVSLSVTVFYQFVDFSRTSILVLVICTKKDDRHWGTPKRPGVCYIYFLKSWQNTEYLPLPKLDMVKNCYVLANNHGIVISCVNNATHNTDSGRWWHLKHVHSQENELCNVEEWKCDAPTRFILQYWTAMH